MSQLMGPWSREDWTEKCLDHGYITVRNIAGPVRRDNSLFDANDTDPANAARFSFDAADQQDRSAEEDHRLAEYLIKNWHTTPFEMVVVWTDMKLPIFVARQFVRHRTVSINELSARYKELPEEWYIPDIEHIGVQPEHVKQGRDRDGVNVHAQEWLDRHNENCQKSYDDYVWAIQNGIPKELARTGLHLNHYTLWLWKQDLHNLMHFMSLRKHSHAQYEAQVYANAVYNLLKKALPKTMELYDEYRAKEF